MKKFTSTALGGAPVNDDDLLDIFNSEIWDAIQALLSPFDNDTEGIVVSGCVTTANVGNFNMTAGIVYLNGEFMRVAAATNQTFTKYIAPSAVVNDTRTYGDGTTNIAAVTKGAGLVSSAPGSGQYLRINSLTDLNNRRLRTSILTDDAGWIAITLVNGWLNPLTGVNPAYRVDKFGRIHLRGAIRSSSSTSETFTTSLPSGTAASFIGVAAGSIANARVDIISGGSAAINTAYYNTLTVYFLDGMSYD